MASEELLALLSGVPDNPFVPYAEYSTAADAITCYFRPDADYSKRLSEHVTLFLAVDTNEVVGCRIKGVKELLEDLPNFLQVKHEDVKLSLLFWSFRGGVRQEDRGLFNRLAQEAGDLRLQSA